MQGLTAGAVIFGFSPATQAWATEAGTDVAPVPSLDGSLTVDTECRREAADDYGHIVHQMPYAVLRPGSVNDIIAMIRFARTHQLKVAMRGQGHVCFGQAQVQTGIVIDSRTLNRIHAIGPDTA